MNHKAAFLILLLLSQTAHGLDIDIRVDSVIKGLKDSLSYEESVLDRPQRFLLSYENVGSVSCRARMRVDIYNQSDLVHTAWSSETPLEPGDYAALEAYYYPQHPGNYTGKVSLHYCNLIEEIDEINFSADVSMEYDAVTVEGVLGNETIMVRKEKSLNETPVSIEAKNTKDSVELGIASEEDLPALIVIPRKYPVGWVFESGRVEGLSSEAKKTLLIAYEPTIWKPSDIVFDVATSDGRIHATYTVKLKEEEKKPQTLDQYIVPGLSAAVLLLLILLIAEKRRK